MSSEWQHVRIDEIADVVGGGTPKTGEPDYWDGDIGWISPRDLSSHSARYIRRGARSITPRGLNESSARLLPAGTVLVSSRAPIGYVAIAAKPLATNQGFKSLVLGQDCLPEFYYYVMSTMKSAMEAVAGGSTFKEISGRAMKALVVPLPPLDEQRAIAEVLGSLDDRVEWAGTLRQVALELLVAVFQHSATERRQVEDLAAVIPGQSPPGTTYNDAGLGLPFYQGSAQFGPLVPEVEKWCSEPQRVAEAGDILFSVRAPVGDLNVAEERCCIGRGVAAIRSRYRATVYAALRSATGEWSIHDSSGTVFGSITGRSLREARIPWPPDIEALSPTLENLLDTAMAAEGEAKVLQAARAALLQKLVSGEIRIENPERLLDQVV